MEQMKAWQYEPDRQDGSGIFIFCENVAVPQPGPEDVLIRIRHASVCGTDESLFSGNLRRVAAGVVPGHEFSGDIVEMGDRVTDLKVGQIVAVESHYQSVGSQEDGIIGLWPPRGNGYEQPFYHGGYAEFAAIPAACAHPLPEAVVNGRFWPSLFEPAGNDFLVAHQVVTQKKPRRVGVVGCGPHGLYAQIFLKHFGVEQIIGFELDPYRAQFARDLRCASEVFDPTDNDLVEKLRATTGGALLDVCIDMVGKSGEGFELSADLTRSGGTIILFGVFSRDYSIADRNANDLIFGRQEAVVELAGKKLKVIGITGREGIWERLIETVAGSSDLQEQLMKPVTIVGPLEKLGEHVRQRRPELLKAAFTPFGISG